MLLRIEDREVGLGIVVVTITGKLMLGPEGQELDKVVSSRLTEGRRKFIFDLSGVTRLDSTGIGHLILCFNKISEHGGKMLLAGATGYLREGFKVSRLDTVFRFYPDVETAAGSLV